MVAGGDTATSCVYATFIQCVSLCVRVCHYIHSLCAHCITVLNCIERDALRVRTGRGLVDRTELNCFHAWAVWARGSVGRRSIAVVPPSHYILAATSVGRSWNFPMFKRLLVFPCLELVEETSRTVLPLVGGHSWHRLPLRRGR
jgi:hypothetical protein